MPRGSSQPYNRINLGTSCSFTCFAGTTFSFGASAVVGGDIGIDAASTSYTGAGLGPLTMDPSGEYSTSAAVDGKVYAADYVASNMSTVFNDIQKGYNYAQLERPVTQSYPGAQTLAGLTMNPGMFVLFPSLSFYCLYLQSFPPSV